MSGEVMDGQTGGQTVGWMDSWVGGRMNGQVSEWVVAKFKGGRVNRWGDTGTDLRKLCNKETRKQMLKTDIWFPVARPLQHPHV